jgi:hypothetical protein
MANFYNKRLNKGITICEIDNKNVKYCAVWRFVSNTKDEALKSEAVSVLPWEFPDEAVMLSTDTFFRNIFLRHLKIDKALEYSCLALKSSI